MLHQNSSAGVIMSNQSLVLQRIDRQTAGVYTCLASNIEGQGESDALQLPVKCASSFLFLSFLVHQIETWRVAYGGLLVGCGRGLGLVRIPRYLNHFPVILLLAALIDSLNATTARTNCWARHWSNATALRIDFQEPGSIRSNVTGFFTGLHWISPSFFTSFYRVLFGS